jgi:hypothetical protein
MSLYSAVSLPLTSKPYYAIICGWSAITGWRPRQTRTGYLPVKIDVVTALIAETGMTRL